MYIDLIVLLVILLLIIMFFRRFSSFVFGFAIIDIFLRLMRLVATNIRVADVSFIIRKYLPASILSVVSNYIKGILYLIFFWFYIIIMFIFLFYIIKIFISKKKI